LARTATWASPSTRPRASATRGTAGRCSSPPRPRTSSAMTCPASSACVTWGRRSFRTSTGPSGSTSSRSPGWRCSFRRSRRASARRPAPGSRGDARTSRSRAGRCSSAIPSWPRWRPSWVRRRRAPGGSSRSRAAPGWARRASSRRRGALRRNRASRCCSRAAPISSRSSPTASSASCSSRCWPRCRPTSARRCFPAPPVSRSGSSVTRS
jgi:hypothetical protein